jgi:hypothetical protein
VSKETYYSLKISFFLALMLRRQDPCSAKHLTPILNSKLNRKLNTP